MNDNRKHVLFGHIAQLAGLVHWIYVDVVRVDVPSSNHTKTLSRHASETDKLPISHSNNAMKASGWTSSIAIGSFFSGSVPLNMASKTGEAIDRINLWADSSCWFISEPTRKWQSAHFPVFSKCLPRARICSHDICQSICESIMEQCGIYCVNYLRCGDAALHCVLVFLVQQMTMTPSVLYKNINKTKVYAGECV